MASTEEAAGGAPTPEPSPEPREQSDKDLDALHGGATELSPSAPAPLSTTTMHDLVRSHEAATAARAQEQLARETELRKVPIAAADVAFLMAEFELQKAVAERQLRLAGGSVKVAAQRLAGATPPQ